jgi:hypothetical protein
MGLIRRRASLGAATALVLAAGTAAGAAPGGSDDSGGAVEAVREAAETTRDVTSAEFEAVLRTPDTPGEKAEITGSLSWDPGLTMDATATGEELSTVPGAPEEVGIVWLDDVVYLNVGETYAAAYGGREWLKADLTAIAEELGKEDLADALSIGLGGTNDGPTAQLALLLESPEIEHVGEETLDGATVDRYQGTVSREDAREHDGSAELLTEEERELLLGVMVREGIQKYEIDVWIDENDFPVRVHESYVSHQGQEEDDVRYSNYGTEVDATAPPSESVVDLLDILEQQGELPH